MEDDTASDCIRTVAATYGCKLFITIRIQSAENRRKSVTDSGYAYVTQ